MRALFAGIGGLPAAIVARLPDPPVIFVMDGFPPDGLTPDITFRLEHLGTLIQGLTKRGVTEVCFAGGVSRPPIDPGQIDAATLPLVPVLQQAMAQGDDGALRGLLKVFEDAGLHIRGAHHYVPDLLPSAGSLTNATPTDAHRRDAQRGASVVAAMAVADVGQACVVHRRQALAIEGIFGTDWMLASLAARPDGRGGILFKAPKPGQDLRVDMPMIGPDTVQGVAEAGLDGIVIEAGGVMVLDQDRVIAECNRLGLFLWVREAAG